MKDLKKRGLWTAEVSERLKYFDGELSSMDEVPADLKRKYATAFSVDWAYLIEAAARRQKWIDQSQSVNLFCPDTDMRTLSHMYRAAWRKGLKTTYYLRTRGASQIEKITTSGGDVQPVRAAVAEAPTEADMANMVCRLNADMTGSICESCQ